MPESTHIHETAIVEKGAELDSGVIVGAYAIVHAGARVGAGTTVGPHSVIEGSVTLGRNNRVSQFASLGSEPQDLKYNGEPTRVEIGDDNTIREFTTVNRGTEGGGGITNIGNSNILMAYSHVAHDCHVGSSVVLANCATLAGHVTIEDYAVVGGLAGIHQYCRIGTSAMIGGASAVVQDVPPFCMAHGNHADLRGLNAIGLRRRGFTAEQIKEVRAAYKILFQKGLKLKDAIETLKRDFAGSEPVQTMVRFVAGSERGIVR